MIEGAAEIVWAGERLVLLPGRAVWLPERDTVLVADVHLGKPASFRAMGVPVPEAVTGRDLDRLSALLHATGAGRLIVLGDLVHDRAALLDRTCDAVRAWRAGWGGVAVDLIPGNHDRKAPACERLGVRVLAPEILLGGLGLTHEPPEDTGVPTLCGHLHPVVSVGPLRTPGRVRSACFWFAGAVGVLPAFGSFTGGCAMGMEPAHAVFAAGERTVIPVTLLAASWAARTPSGTDAFAYDGP
jgi:DNA ligase-associated metallophosphoesterase